MQGDELEPNGNSHATFFYDFKSYNRKRKLEIFVFKSINLPSNMRKNEWKSLSREKLVQLSKRKEQNFDFFDFFHVFLSLLNKFFQKLL